MLECFSAYYEDENPRDPDEPIWGQYTEQQWEQMTVDEQAEAFWKYHDANDKRT